VPSGAKLLVAATAVLAAGLLVAGNAGAQGAAKAVGTCEEKEGTPPSGPNAKNLIELQANKARPTFDVGLGTSPPARTTSASRRRPANESAIG
jgi:hypothetical protein